MAVARRWRSALKPAALVASLVGLACFGVLWHTFPVCPRGEIMLTGAAGWWQTADPNTIAALTEFPASRNDRQAIQLLDVTTGRIRATIQLPPVQPQHDTINRVHFNRSGGGRFFFLANAKRKEVTLWRFDTAEKVATWPGLYADTGEDDRTLALITDDGQGIQLRDIPTGQERCTFPCRPPDPRRRDRTTVYQPFVFSRDGRWLAVADGKDVQLWDLDGPRLRTRLQGHKHPVRAVAFDPDGGMLASRANCPGDYIPDLELRLWDVATASCRFDAVLPRRDKGIESLEFNADGKKLHLGWEFSYRVSDLLAWRRVAKLVNCPDYTDAGVIEAATRRGRFTAQYDVNRAAIDIVAANDRFTLRPFTEDARYAGYLAFSPDDTTLAIGVEPTQPEQPRWVLTTLEKWGLFPRTVGGRADIPRVELWDVSKQKHLATVEGHFANFSSDGKRVLTWHIGDDGSLVQVWDMPPRQPLGWLLAWSGLAALIAGSPVLFIQLWRHRSRN